MPVPTYAGAVPSEKVKLLEWVYDCWGAGDFHTEETYAPEFTVTMGKDFPDAGIHSGREGVAAYMKSFLDPWQRLTIEAEDLVEAGDRVLARVLQSGTGLTSGIEVELRYFQLWSFSGTRPVAMETIMSEDEARAKLEAA
jgi:ketosteroid isomerase-like protein